MEIPAMHDESALLANQPVSTKLNPFYPHFNILRIRGLSQISAHSEDFNMNIATLGQILYPQWTVYGGIGLNIYGSARHK